MRGLTSQLQLKAQPGESAVLDFPTDDFGMNQAYGRAVDDRTLIEPAYQACNHELFIKESISAGTILHSEKNIYTVVDGPRGENLLYGAVVGQERCLVRVFDYNDEAKFQNEVEKLELLNQILEDSGVGEQSLVVKMMEYFSCQLSDNLTVLCIVMEHLESSLSDYLAKVTLKDE